MGYRRWRSETPEDNQDLNTIDSSRGPGPREAYRRPSKDSSVGIARAGYQSLDQANSNNCRGGMTRRFDPWAELMTSTTPVESDD